MKKITKTKIAMKALKFKTLGIALLALLLSFSTVNAEEYKEVKEYNKEFSANKATTLDISNIFGEVTVQNWNENKISVYVKVTTENSDADKAKEMIELIKITFDEDGDIKKAKTELEDKLSKSKTFGKNGNHFSIDYTVKIPSYINVSLSNKFGDLFLDKLDGLANITVKFGNLKVNELTRGNEKPLNTINLAYSDNESVIKKCNWLNIVPRYSELKIEEAQALVLDSKYSEVSIESANSIVCDGAYDELTIDKVNNLVAKGAYTELKIGKVMNKLDLSVKYGECDIDYIAKNFEEIKIIAKFSDVEMSIDEEAGYTIKGVAKYGGIDLPSHIKVSKIEEGMTKRVEGTVGNGKGKIILEAGYGNIEIE